MNMHTCIALVPFDDARNRSLWPKFHHLLKQSLADAHAALPVAESGKHPYGPHAMQILNDM